jgi:hypothetical protein
MSGALHGVLLHSCAHVRLADHQDMATGPEMGKGPIQHGGSRRWHGRKEAPPPPPSDKGGPNGA